MCPHTTIFVSSYIPICVLTLICAFILLDVCPYVLGEDNLVTLGARVIAQMLQREQQLVAVLAQHAHAEGEHSTGCAGDDTK